MTISPYSPPSYLLWTETQFQGQRCRVGPFLSSFLKIPFRSTREKQILSVIFGSKVAFEPQVIRILLKQKTSIKKKKVDALPVTRGSKCVWWMKERGGRCGRKSLRVRIESVPAD